MKIVIISDIHDNYVRLKEALAIAKKENIKTCICCGDISSIEIVNLLAKQFKSVYVAFGNMDLKLKENIELLPENVISSPAVLELAIDGIRIAVVHHDYKARELLKENKYDIIFYGHTHTPWEEHNQKTLLINPGEISGQFGKATFAIFDTKSNDCKLIILK